MAESKGGWLELFEQFVSMLRIDSKDLQGSVDGKGSEFDLWGSQLMFLENVCEGLEENVRTFYCLKARQLGVSTISLAIDIFWLACHPGLQGCLVVDTESNRDKFRLIIHRYIESFPKKFFGNAFAIVKGKDNKNFIHFTNGSTLDFLVAGKRKNSTWGESRAYNFAHVTEVAKYGDPQGLASFRECLSEHHPDRLYIYESTAYGFNHWRDMWIEAGRDVHTKHRFFLGWWSKPTNAIPKNDPRYQTYGMYPPDHEEKEKMKYVQENYGYVVTMEQLAWHRWRSSDQSSSDADVMQNLPWTEDESFVMTGYSFFQVRAIQQDLGRVLDTPVVFKGYRYYLGNEFWSSKMEQITEIERLDEVELRVWQEPVKGAQYVIGVDPAFGRNDWKDRHCCSVWRCYADRLVQVAEYADNNVETRQCAWVLAHLAGAYRDCIVNVELTGGPGRAVLTEFANLRNQLHAEMYEERVADLEWEDFLNQARWYLYHRPDAMGAGYCLNWQTSGSNKFEIMNQLRDSYATHSMDVSSAPLLEEMMTVVQDGAEIGAPGRSKDDRVFAACLANRAWIDWIRAGLVAHGLTYAKVTAIENGETGGPAEMVDRIVFDWFRSREDRSSEPERPKWMDDRGL